MTWYSTSANPITDKASAVATQLATDVAEVSAAAGVILSGEVVLEGATPGTLPLRSKGVSLSPTASSIVVFDADDWTFINGETAVTIATTTIAWDVAGFQGQLVFLGLTSLTSLSLDVSNDTWGVTPVLIGLTALESLSVQGNGFTSSPDLTGMPTLNMVDLGYNKLPIAVVDDVLSVVRTYADAETLNGGELFLAYQTPAAIPTDGGANTDLVQLLKATGEGGRGWTVTVDN